MGDLGASLNAEERQERYERSMAVAGRKSGCKHSAFQSGGS